MYNLKVFHRFRIRNVSNNRNEALRFFTIKSIEITHADLRREGGKSHLAGKRVGSN